MLKNPSFSLFFKINFFITTFIFVAFLFFNEGYGLSSLVITFLGAISTAATLYAIFYLLLLPFLKMGRWILYFATLIFLLADIALVVDFFIYKLFHFHINAMVLNIITSPDAMDSIQVGMIPLVVFSLLLLCLLWFELYIIKRIGTIQKSSQEELNSRLNKWILLPIFLIIVTEKVSYGMASLFSKSEMVSKFKVIPLYQPLTFTKIAAKYFNFKAQDQAKYSIKTNAELHYPLEPLRIDKSYKTFNIFIIASDSFKYSILDEDIAPNIMKFSKDALVFHHHYSGGNSTRFGIFSLMYGMNATYWFSFLNAHQKPILFDVLKQLDYQIDIFSSTNTNWPEFRKTCYVDIQSSIHDEFEGEPWRKDEQNTACFLESLSAYDSTKKHFSFLFMDAPHGYSFPPSENRYNAPSSDVNYLSISKGSTALKSMIKRYKNSIHYNDMLFGKMMDKLKEKNLYDEALIIFTSDHGQEFFEQGNFGHNTSFSEGQIHVPFIVKLPKSLEDKGLGKNINNTLTSHQDVIPSLLSLLGVSNDSKHYSNGKNFFSADYTRRYIFSANWNNNAIVTKEKTYVFSNLPNKMFSNEIRDSKSYEEIKGQKNNSKLILDIINENKKFLK